MTSKESVVPANPFDRLWADTKDAANEAFNRVGESGWYILGKEVEAFEADLGRSLEGQQVVGCASGLDAIEIGLRCLGLKPGDPVLTTPLSAFATTLAIVRAGGKPVFVDVDPQGLLDLDLVEATVREMGVRFLVPVHLFGNSVNLERLAELRTRYDLRIVEDAAQAVGARSGGAMVGQGGQVATFSFYPTKNLGALGDGGALSMTDEALERSARSLRDYGQHTKFLHSELGLNSRLDELHAAVLRSAFLPRLAGWNDRRRALAKRYLEGLKNPAVTLLGKRFDPGAVWHLFPIQVEESSRDALLQHLKARGIQAGVHYPYLIPNQPALKNAEAGYQVVGTLATAKNLCKGEVSLPIHPYLRAEEVDRVVQVVNEWRPY